MPEPTFENIAADFLDFASAEYRNKTGEEVVKLMRGRIDGLLFEMKGYGTPASLQKDLGEMLALVLLAAKKRNVSVKQLLQAFATVSVAA